MRNPYEILNISQDATKEEIQKAFVSAQIENVKTARYSGRDLMEAQKQLMNPGKRLVADFLFPAKFKTKRPKLIETTQLNKDAPDYLLTLDENKLDSLRISMDYV